MTTTQAGNRSARSGAELDRLAIDTIRFLAADMVQAAGSGHPGLPLGAAPMAWTLFSRHLRHDPSDPRWPDRDRFVLSAGHGSALQYALLNMFGYGLATHDLERFRQLGSPTPGHPEFGQTVGVETTTGPLGQGLATAVGMALAERMQAARFPEITDHRTYALVGDGCLMEGISHEAASLAGHLGLGRLTVLFDDNEITIDGRTTLSCSDDHLTRFEAYGWQVARVDDGTDVGAIDAAIHAAHADPRPSFLAVRTTIGHGAPGIEGTSKAHGAPLGEQVLIATKAAAGWQYAPFAVPVEVSAHCAQLARDGQASRRAWLACFSELASVAPARATEFRRRLARRLPDEQALSIEPGDDQPLATRQSSQLALRRLAARLPELVGGSADLAGSTGTATGQRAVTRDDYSGSVINFGIREFAMAAVLNGLSLHGGFRPYGSTFLVFSDYLRPGLRLSALMKQPVIYIFTHDSIAVGEDGPTHQPVEHLESLRLIPGLTVLRPADQRETVAAWKVAISNTSGPTVLVLSRQALPPLRWDRSTPADFLSVAGGRVVHPATSPAVNLVATGSEVATACAAAVLLAGRGIRAQVLSVPWRERFQDHATDLLTAPVTVTIEAGSTAGWRGLDNAHPIGLDAFGASGRGSDVLAQYGFTAEQIAARVVEILVGETR